MAIIKIKRGTSDPSAANVTNIGELAANTSTPKLFIKTASDSTTTPVWIGAQIESSPGDWTSAVKLATQSAINTTFMPKSGGTFTGVTSFGQGSTAAGEIRLLEDTDDGANYTGFRGSARAANITYVMPTTDPTNGQVLSAGTVTSNVSQLSWVDIGTATTATNIAGGAAGSLPYQTAASTTAFLADPNSAGAILTYNDTSNAPEWSAGTGTGSPVRATSPTLTTPTLGVASATSVNKVAITAPATGSTLTIADGKTLTASNTLTFTGTDASSVAFGTGGTVAYTGNNLSVFAATTSSQLAGVISDETGSGALVFGTSPAFTTSVTTGSTSFDAFNTTATTLNFGGAATTFTMGATTGTAHIRNSTLKLGNTTNTITTNGASGSNHLTLAPYGDVILAPTSSVTPLNSGTFPTVTVNPGVQATVDFAGGDIYLGRKSSDDVVAVVTPVNIIWEGATDDNYETTLTVAEPTDDRTITLPNATGTVALVAGSDTQVMFNDGGSALGGDSGLTYNKTTDSLTITGDLAVNGADITTTSTGTATVFNTNATTVNAFGAATTVTIGSSTATINLGGGSTGATVNVKGNLVVEGTTTTINSTTLTVDDKNIEMGSVTTPTNTTADGGGITLAGGVDGNKTIIWDSTNANWTSSEHWNIASTKVYKINNTQVLSASALGSGVTTSSLTTVGALSSGSITTGFTQITAANMVGLAALDIDGGTATTTIVGSDLLIVDDGANGTNRYVTVDNLFGTSSTATIDGGTY